MKFIVNVEGQFVVDAPDKEAAKKLAEGLLARDFPGLHVSYGEPKHIFEPKGAEITGGLFDANPANTVNTES
ncbi:hypothetical protein LCGC14_0457900 [marine sediment metagenome]|uniref:Uncharacterized protein n=1 Tax=marine sediment metagenome TaxID=412755 RepID=A0A0F9SYN6_9ZZZZ